MRGLSFIFVLFSFLGCSFEHPKNTELTRDDSISVIQAGLNDKILIREISRGFKHDNQLLRVARYRVIHNGYDLTFVGRKIPIMPEDEWNKLSEDNSKEFVVTVPSLRFKSFREARMSMVFYPGQVTFLYTFIKVNGKWQITSREIGKI